MEYHRINEIASDGEVGDLIFKQYSLETQCRFDKMSNVCLVPFDAVEIKQNGDVYLCCPAWNSVMVGNLFEEDIKDIWNGKKATIVRRTILDGSYKYCNEKTCPAMLAGGGSNIVPKDTFVDPARPIPKNFAFSIDRTCNLECPSCREGKILTTGEHDRKNALTLLRNLFRSLFSEPHDQEIIMTFDGSGEIFHSAVYREIFETEPAFRDFEKWPNFKVVLCTNGTMMTEKIQMKYDYLFKRSLAVRVSIDAGNKESYLRVRKGGDWDLLWENLNQLYHGYIRDSSHRQWAWNLILQDDNFESIPELIEMAYKYPENLPEIYITNILDWDLFSPEVFGKKAVWLPTSPRHSLMREVMALPIVKNYPNIMRPF